MAAAHLALEAMRLAAELNPDFDSDSYVGPSGAAVIEAFGVKLAARLAIARRTGARNVTA